MYFALILAGILRGLYFDSKVQIFCRIISKIEAQKRPAFAELGTSIQIEPISFIWLFYRISLIVYFLGFYFRHLRQVDLVKGCPVLLFTWLRCRHRAVHWQVENFFLAQDEIMLRVGLMKLVQLTTQLFLNLNILLDIVVCSGRRLFLRLSTLVSYKSRWLVK